MVVILFLSVGSGGTLGGRVGSGGTLGGRVGSEGTLGGIAGLLISMGFSQFMAGIRGPFLRSLCGACRLACPADWCSHVRVCMLRRCSVITGRLIIYSDAAWAVYSLRMADLCRACCSHASQMSPALSRGCFPRRCCVPPEFRFPPHVCLEIRQQIC